MIDEAGQYAHLDKHFTEHDYVRHSAGEYGRGATRTTTAEGFYSLLKRGMNGVYQPCSETHLHRYIAEFDSRWNHRTRLGSDGAGRTQRAPKGIAAKRLAYRSPHL